MKVLFAVLNWGLGHATRSAPLIRALLARNANVTIASDGEALVYLQNSFPELNFISLPPYPVEYGKTGLGTALKLVTSAPGIRTAIRKEGEVIRELIRKEKLNCIISDNRYGCHHPDVFSLLMTHQLQVKAPIASLLVNTQIRYHLSRFEHIWIPDYAEPAQKLSGDLSKHGPDIGKQVEYIGPISNLPTSEAKQDLEWLGIVSGPEPQQSIFYNKLLELRNKYPGKMEVVKGLSQQQLSPLWNRAQKVICRAGYSSIMDAHLHHKPALIIPTPGQGEQQYLSRHLKNNPLFLSVQQDNLQVNDLNWKPENKKVHQGRTSLYKEAIDSLFIRFNC